MRYLMEGWDVKIAFRLVTVSIEISYINNRRMISIAPKIGSIFIKGAI